MALAAPPRPGFVVFRGPLVLRASRLHDEFIWGFEPLEAGSWRCSPNTCGEVSWVPAVVHAQHDFAPPSLTQAEISRSSIR